MEGIFVYTDRALREAVRARAYRQDRTMSDVARDALYEALTVPVPDTAVIARAGTRYLIAKLAGKYIFAWSLRRIERVWAPDIAPDVSAHDEGVVWCESLREAQEEAAACFQNAADADKGSRDAWEEIARSLGVSFAPSKRKDSGENRR